MATLEGTVEDPVQVRARLEFETLISDLSSRFINLPASEVDREIEVALRGVCELLGVDFAILWQWSAGAPGLISPTHSHPPGAVQAPQPDVHEQYPWSVEQMLAGRPIVASSLDELPAEGAIDRESARLAGIQSNLTLPLAVGGEQPVGALAFNTLRAARDWPDVVVKRLQLVAQVFANALARRRRELSLRAGQVRLEAGADLAGLAFYEVDFREQTTFVDDRFADVCGIPPDARQGMQALAFWVEHLHADDRERTMKLRRDMHEGKVERLNLEYRYLHPAHGERWLHHVARVTERDAAAQVVRTFGVLRDVTERRQREEALRRSLAEIERLKDRLQAESDYLKAEISAVRRHGELTGKSPAIQKVLQLVEQVAPTDSTVLLCGETGSGKELVAEALHRLSPRRARVMVKVNCAALPSGLVESELFGREKGAFTGALTKQVGRFEVADGSTLFLDEVGEISLEVQAKLLRVLEAGEFERLGSPRTVKVDVRLVASTNRELLEQVRKGRFREDLYYRLNVFPIRVPPLRERTEDIPLLAWTLLEEISSRMGKKITQVPRRTMEALQRHSWPGNVRELKNVIEHGAILTTGDTLRAPLLGDETTPAGNQEPTLSESERQLILRTLERRRWHVKGPNGAAAALGLKPSTLYSRMKKLGIRPSAEADGAQ
jgi:formate hydrogenlyase transcriptional activator